MNVTVKGEQLMAILDRTTKKGTPYKELTILQNNGARSGVVVVKDYRRNGAAAKLEMKKPIVLEDVTVRAFKRGNGEVAIDAAIFD